MAMWKKIAEAFGRAAYGKNNAEKPIVKWARDRFDKDVDRYADPEASARAEAFARGQDEAWMDAQEIKRKMGMDKYRANPDEAERRMDELGEVHTDERLEQDFDEGFNSAIKRRKQDAKDFYGKDYPQDMAEEGADTFEEDLWRVIDELRDKGMSGNDILNTLKGSTRYGTPAD